MTTLDALKNSLRGVIAFPITPMQVNLDLDLDGLSHNIDWLIGHGMRAMVAAGGTGELYSLTVEETNAVHRNALEAAKGRAAGIENVVAYKEGSADLRLWARIRARMGTRLGWVGGVGDDMVHTNFAAGAEGFRSSVKAAMQLCGLPAGPVRPPLVELNDGERDSVRQLVERLGLRAKVTA